MKDSKEITVEQTMWPIHCVRQTSGSDFHDDIIITRNSIYAIHDVSKMRDKKLKDLGI
jgi:nicotinamidase-related amidase